MMRRTLSEPEPVTGPWVYTEAVYLLLLINTRVWYTKKRKLQNQDTAPDSAMRSRIRRRWRISNRSRNKVMICKSLSHRFDDIVGWSGIREMFATRWRPKTTRYGGDKETKNIVCLRPNTLHGISCNFSGMNLTVIHLMAEMKQRCWYLETPGVRDTVLGWAERSWPNHPLSIQQGHLEVSPRCLN